MLLFFYTHFDAAALASSSGRKLDRHVNDSSIHGCNTVSRVNGLRMDVGVREGDSGDREGVPNPEHEGSKPAGFSVLKGRKLAFPSYWEDVSWDPTCPGGSTSCLHEGWTARLLCPPGLDSGSPDLFS